MTDSVSDVSTSRTGRIAPVWLILICAGALAFYLLMLRSWPSSAQSTLILPLAGFALASGAGIFLGLWWSKRPERAADDEQVAAQPQIEPEPEPVAPVARHSALVEEEHIVGGHQLHVKTDAAANPADFDGALETVAMTLPVDMMPADETPETTSAEAEREADELDQVLAANNADVTPPDVPAQTDTDRQEFENALHAKDQVIESLEDIVKENRDRWSDFESQRDELREKIENLEAELRIANDIIEGVRGTSDDEPFERPQVLSRA